MNKENEQIYQIEIQKEISLNDKFKGYQIKLMHNEKENGALASQVEKITNGDLTYGQFRHEIGFLYNELEKIAIVMPERVIKDAKLIQAAKDVSNKDANYIIKKDLSDIDYLARENHAGEVSIDGSKHDLFSKKGAMPSEDIIYIIKQKSEVKLDNKPKPSKSNALKL